MNGRPLRKALPAVPGWHDLDSDVPASRSTSNQSTGLPLPPIITRRPAHPMFFAVSVVDSRGRVVAASIIDTLGWRPGHVVAFAVSEEQVVTVQRPLGTATPRSLRGTIRRSGRLILPATLRHRAGINQGNRLLLAANETSQLLQIYPALVLAAILQGHHDVNWRAR
ncbi:AbrB/MazE/SpoVT family DNA-binding domain-containing protein [Actinoplanes sp. NBC_00393]|uniref:AbrB/MazE/SpoVT family DNA-binding domain-containing protein n=1 Tax=Actinoplanes sp. NBC_00393 TaxID=2975953 RepID=UPI002E221C54